MEESNKNNEKSDKNESIGQSKPSGAERSVPNTTSHCNRIKSWCSQNKKQTVTMAFLTLALISSIAIGFASYSNVNSECDELRSGISSYDEKIATLQESNTDLRNKVSALENEKESLKAELDGYQDQQATIDDEKTKLEELHAQLDTLQTERDSLQGQVDAKKLEEEKKAKQQNEQRIEKESKSAGAEQTVYWVPNGKCYHTTQNCPTLKRSSDIRSGTISASGKSRCCKVCG